MNTYTQVGLTTLVGLITKHNILIAEVAKEEQLHHGLNRIDAVRKAATVRLRPILMTTAAMVAGLSIGMLFTLLILPGSYSFSASTHQAKEVFDESLKHKVHEKIEQLD